MCQAKIKPKLKDSMFDTAARILKCCQFGCSQTQLRVKLRMSLARIHRYLAMCKEERLLQEDGAGVLYPTYKGGQFLKIYEQLMNLLLESNEESNELWKNRIEWLEQKIEAAPLANRSIRIAWKSGLRATLQSIKTTREEKIMDILLNMSES